MMYLFLFLFFNEDKPKFSLEIHLSQQEDPFYSISEVWAVFKA